MEHTPCYAAALAGHKSNDPNIDAGAVGRKSRSSQAQRPNFQLELSGVRWRCGRNGEQLFSRTSPEASNPMTRSAFFQKTSYTVYIVINKEESAMFKSAMLWPFFSFIPGLLRTICRGNQSSVPVHVGQFAGSLLPRNTWDHS
jgi:hypothetical protein